MVRTSMLVAAVAAVVGCRSATPSTSPAIGSKPAAATEPACLADGLGPVRAADSIDDSCEEDASCERRCTDGDAHACLIHAWDVQAGENSEAAQPWFERGCQRGLAIGCTNFGAYLWRPDDGAADTRCARRLFDRGCAVGESMACGMVARLMATEATTPAEQAEARQLFTRLCDEHGSYHCRMFAHHLERGQLGPIGPGEVAAVLQRACESGDQRVCGLDSTRGVMRD